MSRSKHDGSDTRFSPRRWWAVGITFFWVALVTVLVWIYADMEFTREDKVAVTVRLHTKGSRDLEKDLVLLSKPAADPEAKVIAEKKVKLVFELRGNRGGLDSFLSKHHDAAFEYDVSGSPGLGDNQEIAAIRVVSKEFKDDIGKYGLSLLSASTIEGIHIDERTCEKLPVKFDYIGAELAQEPKLTMGVWARRAQWDKIKQNLAKEKGRLELRTVQKDLKNAERGRRIEVSAEIIRKIAGVQVEPEQTTITVPIEIREFTESKKMEVTVRFLIPYTWLEEGKWDEHKLTRKEQDAWRPEIEVTGAREDLGRLNPEDVDAYVVLKDDDKKTVESWLTRTVEFRFPPDLKVELTGKPPKVEFRLDSREVGTARVPTTP